MEDVQVLCDVKVSFHAYESKVKNKKARRQIVRWIKDSLKGECSFIPLYIDNEVEDCTSKSSVYVWEG